MSFYVSATRLVAESEALVDSEESAVIYGGYDVEDNPEVSCTRDGAIVDVSRHVGGRLLSADGHDDVEYEILLYDWDVGDPRLLEKFMA